MKKYYSIATLSLLFILGTLSSVNVSAQSSVNNWTCDNYLKIKGDILHDVKADIMIFTYDEDSNAWVKTYEKKNKKSFTIKLNPEINHQVWFTDSEGYTKILYVEGGQSGPWFKPLDIDFTTDGYACAKLYQLVDDLDYCLTAVNRGYDFGNVIYAQQHGLSNTNR